MIKFEVKITGPGMCVNNILAIVEDALKKAGATVEVENKYPDEGTPTERLDWAMAHAADDKVLIKADHLPWGG